MANEDPDAAPLPARHLVFWADKLRESLGHARRHNGSRRDACAGVQREAFEETGVRCEPVALAGVYDSRIWDGETGQHLYKFTFLCRPVGTERAVPSHAIESLETGWFREDALPPDLYQGHRKRIQDGFRVWHGEPGTYSDRVPPQGSA